MQELVAPSIESIQKRIKDHKPHFSKKELDVIHFDNYDKGNIFLKPDFSSIRQSRPKKIDHGSGFDVFQVGDKIMKVERIAVRVDPETGARSTHYPWMALGIRRHKLEKIENAVERKKAHLDTKGRLESVGIKTADYVGSIIIPSKKTLLTNTNADKKRKYQFVNPAKEASRRMQRSNSVGNIPIYSEVWENIGGMSLDADEKTVERIYKTPEGRAKMKELALNLLKLSKTGFIFDVSTSIQGVSRAPRTKKGFPFPRNFFAKNIKNIADLELIAVDFNRGIDLTKEPWWRDDFDMEKLVMRSIKNHKLYPESSLKIEMGKSIDSISIALSFEEKMNFLRSGNENARKKYEHIRKENDIFHDQLELLFGQIHTSVAILQKIEEIEGIEVLQI